MSDVDRTTTALTRMAPLTGLAFVAMAVAAAVVIGQYSYLPPADELASVFEEDATRVQLGAYLGAISAVFLLWFSGSLRSHLRLSEGGTGRLSAVAFGGGVAGAAIVSIAFSILAVAGARGGAAEITPGAAMVLYDVYGSLLGLAAPAAVAALVGATSIVGLRSGALAGWLAWSGVVLAIGLISPFSYIFVAISFVWIVVLAPILFRKQGAARAR